MRNFSSNGLTSTSRKSREPSLSEYSWVNLSSDISSKAYIRQPASFSSIYIYILDLNFGHKNCSLLGFFGEGISSLSLMCG